MGGGGLFPRGPAWNLILENFLDGIRFECQSC